MIGEWYVPYGGKAVVGREGNVEFLCVDNRELEQFVR
jgi:hypothetical protein